MLTVIKFSINFFCCFVVFIDILDFEILISLNKGNFKFYNLKNIILYYYINHLFKKKSKNVWQNLLKVVTQKRSTSGIQTV